MVPGMTLQDWFAGQIIAAMMGSDPSNCSTRDANGRLCGMEPARLANMAKNAYQTADALMQVRAALHPIPQGTVGVGQARHASVG